MSKKTPMTTDAAARIQSAEALNNDGKVNAGTFPADFGERDRSFR